MKFLRNILKRKQKTVEPTHTSLSTEREVKFKFNGYLLLFSCPFCSEPQDIGGHGQSILWIAIECINDGEAISFCSSCERHFRIPDSIFSEGILLELEKEARKRGHLYNYVDAKYVKTDTQLQLLQSNWYSILIDANASGPVDVMSMPWTPRERCPYCNLWQQGFEISFNYACPYCRHKIAIAQQDVDNRLGANVICRYCGKQHFIPPTIWCPKCQQNLREYHSVLRRIAEVNRVSFEQLRLK